MPQGSAEGAFRVIVDAVSIQCSWRVIDTSAVDGNSDTLTQLCDSQRPKLEGMRDRLLPDHRVPRHPKN